MYDTQELGSMLFYQILGSTCWHLGITFNHISAFAIALLICTDQDNVLHRERSGSVVECLTETDEPWV